MEVLLQVLSTVSDVAGITGAVISGAIWMRLKFAEEKLQENVRVLLRLQSGEREIDLPLALKRRDLSRAELLGRIGMLPMKQKGSRFAIRSLSTITFVQGLNAVVEGENSTLIIPCSAEEIDQFDI